MRLDPETVRQRHEVAWERKNRWYEYLREVFHFALPDHDPYLSKGSPTGTQGQHQRYGTEGQRKRQGIFDSTLNTATIKTANRIAMDAFPDGLQWMHVVPGIAVTPEQEKEARLIGQHLQKYAFQALSQSRWPLVKGEFALDLVAGGTGLFKMDHARGKPVVCSSVSQAFMALDEGPDQQIWGFFRPVTLARRLVRPTWPDAHAIVESKDEWSTQDEQLNFIEATYYDWDEDLWYYDVLVKDKSLLRGNEDMLIVSREYTKCPWIYARWLVAAGEIYGRSPAMAALPDSRAVNKVKEVILQDASLKVPGIFTYKGRGTFNPQTNIVFRTGMFLAVDHPAGPNQSISRLDVGGDLHTAEITLDMLRMDINKNMMNKDLPPDAGAVRSATEIIERVKDLQVDQGPPIARVLQEMGPAMMERTLDLLVQADLLPEFTVLQEREGKPPLKRLGVRIDGEQFKLEFVSPLAMSENLADAERVVQAVQMTALGGQEAILAGWKVEDFAQFFGRKLSVDETLLRSDKDRKLLQGMLGELMASRAGAGAGGVGQAEGGAG